MRRAIVLAVGIAAGAAGIGSALPAHAEFGAIAYDEGTGRRGVAWNYETQKGAEDAALRDCGIGCKVVVRIGPKLCFAIATPASGKGIGAASRPSVEAAKTGAVEDCKKHNSGECVVRDSHCNR